MPSRSASRDKAGLHLAAALALQDEGEENVVLQREGVEKAEVLKDEAEVVAAEGRRALLGDLGEVLPAEEDRAAGGGGSSAARRFRSVVLPLPLSPMTATYSPLSTEKVTLLSASTLAPPKRVV